MVIGERLGIDGTVLVELVCIDTECNSLHQN